jgi:hypothetical protein
VMSLRGPGGKLGGYGGWWVESRWREGKSRPGPDSDRSVAFITISSVHHPRPFFIQPPFVTALHNISPGCREQDPGRRSCTCRHLHHDLRPVRPPRRDAMRSHTPRHHQTRALEVVSLTPARRG